MPSIQGMLAEKRQDKQQKHKARQGAQTTNRLQEIPS